jgi:hypothetical protein
MVPNSDEEVSNDSYSNNVEYGVVLKKKKNRRRIYPQKMKIHIKYYNIFRFIPLIF